MSTVAPTANDMRASGGGPDLARFARRNGWVLALWALLAGMLLLTKLIQPDYGATGIRFLALTALPLAFAAAGQAIAVISGGIDLSIASMMALTNVVAAVLMLEYAGGEISVAIVVGTLLLGVVLGATNGVLIVITRVPDIVVTLAMLFVWGGVALMVIDNPGGTAAEWLKQLIQGTVGGAWIPTAISDWVPKALALLIGSMAIIWIPLRRSRVGVSIYAVGSDRLAAFRSGVSIGWTKIAAYTVTGLFAGLGGLALTMDTGIGTPTPGDFLLPSVAAVVLGGVSLAGGRGGLVGPILAVFVLRLVRTDLTFLGVDPNYTSVIEGAIMILVVMIGGVLAMRGRQA